MAISLCLVHNKWRITRRIGGGSFGEIYMGVGPNLEKVAVKFEKESSRCPQLRHEYKVYRELVNCHGFCCVYYFGAQDSHNVMVMDLMGPSLEDLFNKCARKFSLKTVLQIADQLLERADTLHARHLIHRDIKPANFVIGIGDQGANVYCVDFGLSKRYRHPKTLQHIPHRDGRSLTGTPRYASINNHLGIEQSRRDDLESIAYILIYFLKGTLPWQGLKAKNASKKYLLILSKKQSVSIAQLCQGCPSQFAEFLAYSRSLKFDAKPDIPYLRKIFRDLYNTQGCASVSKMWDWDAIDADYFTNSPNGQQPAAAPVAAPAPPILQTQAQAHKPTITAAVAGAGDSDYITSLHKGAAAGTLFNSARGSRNDEEEDDGAGAGYTANGKRMQAGAVAEATRPSSTAVNRQTVQTQFMPWGFARPTGTGVLPVAGVSKSEHRAAPVSDRDRDRDRDRISDFERPVTEISQGRRPHTANDGEGHVVAGARAMMRYRNNKSVDGTVSNGEKIAQAAVTATGLANSSAASGGKGWSGAGSGVVGSAQHGAGKYPAVGGASSGPSQGFSGVLVRSGTSKAAPSSSAQPGWVGSDRPRSAVVAAGSSGRTAAQASTANSNTLSYGNLKNRFLSGAAASGSAATKGEVTSFGAQSGGGTGVGVGSGVGTGTASIKPVSGPSKLFASLAR